MRFLWRPRALKGSYIDLGLRTKRFQRIIHVGDIHIRNVESSRNRNVEYMDVFDRLSQFTESHSADNSLVVVAGDIFHAKSVFDPTSIQLFFYFLRCLSKHAPVLLIGGNHDFRQDDRTEPDVLQHLISGYAVAPPASEGSAQYPVHYLATDGVYRIGNVEVGHVTTRSVRDPSSGSGRVATLPPFPQPVWERGVDFAVALYHGGVESASLDNVHQISKSTVPRKWFTQPDDKPSQPRRSFDAILLGDTHKRSLDGVDGCVGDGAGASFRSSKKVGWGYCGSLIQQNFGESIRGHGGLVWELDQGRVRSFDLLSHAAFITVRHKFEEGLKSSPPAQGGGVKDADDPSLAQWVVCDGGSETPLCEALADGLRPLPRSDARCEAALVFQPSDGARRSIPQCLRLRVQLCGMMSASTVGNRAIDLSVVNEWINSAVSLVVAAGHEVVVERAEVMEGADDDNEGVELALGDGFRGDVEVGAWREEVEGRNTREWLVNDDVMRHLASLCLPTTWVAWMDRATAATSGGDGPCDQTVEDDAVVRGRDGSDSFGGEDLVSGLRAKPNPSWGQLYSVWFADPRSLSDIEQWVDVRGFHYNVDRASRDIAAAAALYEVKSDLSSLDGGSEGVEGGGDEIEDAEGTGGGDADAKGVSGVVRELHLHRVEWDWMFCYGAGCSVDFDSLSGHVVALHAPNGFGKSAFMEVVCCALYGEGIPSRAGLSKGVVNVAVDGKSKRIARTKILFSVNGQLWKIDRVFDGSAKTPAGVRKSATLTPVRPVRAAGDEGVMDAHAQEPSLKTVRSVGQWVRHNVGTLSAFLMSGMLTQAADNDFFNLDATAQADIVGSALNITRLQAFEEVVRIATRSYESIAKEAEILRDKSETALMDAEDAAKRVASTLAQLKSTSEASQLRINDSPVATLDRLSRVVTRVTLNVAADVDPDIEVLRDRATTHGQHAKLVLGRAQRKRSLKDAVEDVISTLSKEDALLLSRLHSHFSSTGTGRLRGAALLCAVHSRLIDDARAAAAAAEAAGIAVETATSKLTAVEALARDAARADSTLSTACKKAEDAAVVVQATQEELDSAVSDCTECEQRQRGAADRVEHLQQAVATELQSARDASAEARSLANAGHFKMHRETAGKEAPHEGVAERLMAFVIAAISGFFWRTVAHVLRSLKLLSLAKTAERKATAAYAQNGVRRPSSPVRKQPEATPHTAALREAFEAARLRAERASARREQASQQLQQARGDVKAFSQRLNVCRKAVDQTRRALAVAVESRKVAAQQREEAVTAASLVRGALLEHSAHYPKQLEVTHSNGHLEALAKDIVQQQASEVARLRGLKDVASTTTAAADRRSSIVGSLIVLVAGKHAARRKDLDALRGRLSDVQLAMTRDLATVAARMSAAEEQLGVANAAYATAKAVHRNAVDVSARASTVSGAIKFAERVLAVYRVNLFRDLLIPLISRCANQVLSLATGGTHLWVSGTMGPKGLEWSLAVAGKSDRTVGTIAPWSPSAPPIPTPMEKASGYQRFVCGLSLRLALSAIGGGGLRCRQLFIDEGFSVCDADNLIRMRSFLVRLQRWYTCIIVVSHLVAIRNSASRVVCIERPDATGPAYLVVGGVDGEEPEPRAEGGPDLNDIAGASSAPADGPRRPGRKASTSKKKTVIRKKPVPEL